MSFSYIEPLGDLVEMDFAEPRSSDDFQVFADFSKGGTCCDNIRVATTNDGHRTQQCVSCGHYYLKDGKVPTSHRKIRKQSPEFQLFGTDWYTPNCCENPDVYTTNDGNRTQQCWNCGHYYLKDWKRPDGSLQRDDHGVLRQEKPMEIHSQAERKYPF